MVHTNYTLANPVRAASLIALMSAMKSQPKPQSPGQGYYDIKASDKGLLVDPINGAPFVFVPPVACFEFTHEPGNSGTEHLRARMHAQVFFDALNANPNTTEVAHDRH